MGNYLDNGLDQFLNRDTLSNDQISSINVDSKVADGSLPLSKISNLKVDTIEVSPTGYIRSGKTSFIDTALGWYQSAEGIYFGAAADATKFKFKTSDGSIDLVGTISSKSTADVAAAFGTGANAQNIITDLINTRINTSAKTILSAFSFSPTDYSGAFKTGDIAWNTATGVITGGSGGLFNKNGLVFANAGVPTITLDGITGNATFGGTLTAPSGTLGTITAGNIQGTTINIPNATTPLFSVDSVGNIKVKSLARDDFHWFTVFESIDGYGLTTATGTVTCNNLGVHLTTGATTFNECAIQKILAGGFTWNKNRNFKVYVNFQDQTFQNSYIITGFYGTDEHIGFYISAAGRLYATLGNGTTQETIDLMALPSGGLLLECKLIAGTSVKYYVNGTYRDEITQNIPTGTLYSNTLFNSWLKTTTSSAKVLDISWLDFWQSN